MIELTMGLMITLVGIIGIIGSVIALIITAPIFKKQRRKMLEEIEEN